MASRLRQAAVPAPVVGLLIGFLAFISIIPSDAAPPDPPASAPSALLRAHPFVTLRTGSERSEGAGLSAPHVPGEALVGFRRGLDRVTTQAIVARLGGRVKVHIPAINVSLIELPEMDLALALNQLNAQPEVEFAEPNYLLELDDILIPNDPDYAIFQKGYLDRLEMPAAWALSTGDPSTVIAIVDTGIDMNHSELASAIWFNPGEIPGNGIDDDRNGFVDDIRGWDFAYGDNNPIDDYGHGTHVAGIAAARTNNNKGIAGIAGGNNDSSGARLMAVKVFRGRVGTDAAVMQGLVYAADNGARIINMSFGGYAYSRANETAINYAWQRGAVLIASAGNDSKNRIHYPSAHPVVIGVAATDTNDNPANFTNYGSFISVAAPGVNIWSTIPGNSYFFLSGTSMSAPHVSGLAALVWAHNPHLSNTQVRQVIEASADDLGVPGRDFIYGFGRINARQALELAGRTPGDQVTPSPTPAPQPVWPPDCQDLIQAGSFETSDLSAWNFTGAITRTRSPAPTQAYGLWAMKLAGKAGATAELWQNIPIPATATALTLEFGCLVESQDTAWGPDVDDPHTDHLRGEFRDAAGRTLFTFLRDGNRSDAGTIDPTWGEFLFPLPSPDVRALRNAGTVQLYFYADNDADPSPPTNFYIDGVRLCAGQCTQAGDVNSDGTVDLVDVMQVANHWPAYAGGPGYEVKFDLNLDGHIDVLDVMSVAIHWGESCYLKLTNDQ